MEVWYEKFDFKANPFSIKPAAFHDEMIGYEEKVEDIIDDIDEGSLWFIGGKYGTGKTTILKRIINTFKGEGKLIYFSLNRSDKSVDFNRLLKNRGNFLQMLFGMRAKNCILLLDESQRLTTKDSDMLLDLLDEGYFRSIVFVSDKFENVHFTDELKKKIGKNILEVGELSPEEAVDLVRSRIGDLDFISDKLIKKVFEKSHKNPRRFLSNMEDVFMLAHKENASKITESHITKALK